MADSSNASFIWSIADSLRGPFKPAEYGDVVLPFTILRRLDAVLEGTKRKVLAEYEKSKEGKVPVHLTLPSVSGHSFYNVSPFDMGKLAGDSDGLRQNIEEYIAGFSGNVRDIFDRFDFAKTLDKLDDKDKLFAVTKKFAAADLHPETVSNIEMGLIFEELIRKFNDASNETAGDHFTPREVISLMVNLLFALDDDALQKPGTTRSIYDPTCGTGGMLSVADERLRKFNPQIDLALYGQDYNDFSYAVCKADMVIKGQEVGNIRLGDTLVNDNFPEKSFDYAMSNPPFGVDWNDQRKQVQKEHDLLGFLGRFGPGLPKVSDGAMLFLLHLIKKMRPIADGGSRVGIVLNGSPLFTGGAGSGESNIRKWILDNDLLEAIIALPTDMFYNTPISTYVWVLSNRKEKVRENKVQLIDGSKFYRKMQKGLGLKRNELGPDDVSKIVKLYADFEQTPYSKIFDRESFLYRTITVERPLRLSFAVTPDRLDAVFEDKAIEKLDADTHDHLRTALRSLVSATVWKNRGEFQTILKSALHDAKVKLGAPALKAVLGALSERDDTADVCTDGKGFPEPDSARRDTENVQWAEDIREYFEREVKPFAPDAWIDESKTKEGAEIPLTRHFYEYVAPRQLTEIDQELNAVVDRLRVIIGQVES